MEQAEFNIEVERVDGRVTVRVAGELDAYTSAEYLAKLDGGRPHLPPTVVIDLSAVTFLDVAGLRAILGARDRLRADGQEVRFGEVSGPVDRLLRLLDIEL